jgi:hypothetical protein
LTDVTAVGMNVELLLYCCCKTCHWIHNWHKSSFSGSLSYWLGQGKNVVVNVVIAVVVGVVVVVGGNVVRIGDVDGVEVDVVVVDVVTVVVTATHSDPRYSWIWQ